MNGKSSKRMRTQAALIAWALLFPVASPAADPPTELKPKTMDAFQRYVRLSEVRINEEERTGKNFLWVDGQPEPRRKLLYEQMRRGELALERLKTLDNGKEIEAPDGLIHHWTAAMFLPGVTVEQAVALQTDYDRHVDIFKPAVVRSKLISRDGNNIRMMLCFYRKKIVTVVLETEQDVYLTRLNNTRAYIHAYTRRVQEVENYGEKTERLLPQGNDRGFMWHLYTYWRYEERDGGTYIQCESITLSRDIPWALRWLIGPFVKSVPRESLEFVMTSTRTTLKKDAATASSDR